MRGTGRSQGRAGRRGQWVAGTAMRHRTATTARPLLWGRSRLGRAPACAGAACATQLWFVVCVVATVAVLLLVELLPNPTPRFATGLARLPVQRATRAVRPRGRPNRSLSHCRPKRQGDGESGTNRREDCRADSDSGDLGNEMVRDVHSVPPVDRPAGHHATRRPSGVTTPRCRRLGRSARRRWRTR